jgi:uncharacterized protein (UPF0212 family)
MDIDAGSKECPICGYEFPSYSPAFKWAALLLALLFLFSFIMVVTGYW